MPARLGDWNCTASSSSRVSTGVDILRVAASWAWAIDVHNGPKALALARRDEVQGRELQEGQPGFDGALHQLALVVVDRVPLVDGQHHRAPAFQDVAGNVRVLVGHALGGVEQQQHDIGRSRSPAAS